MFLKIDMRKGIFITFEGIDGSGKTSLSQLVFDRLIELNCKGIHTFEPTDTFLGNSIRDIILLSEEKLNPYQQVFLFTADRISHFLWIQQKLHEFEFVICDRFIHSTLAYQGIDEKIRESIYTIHNLCLKDYEPDIVFLLDIEPEISLQRIQQSEKDNFEKVEFLTGVRARYLEIADAFPKTFIKLDGNLPINKLLEIVLEELRKRFGFFNGGKE